jgi:hypothetical protein
MLNAGSERDARAAYLNRSSINESRIKRQDAETLAGVNRAAKDTDFNRDLFRDDQRRQHDIGLKRMELAGKGGAGSRLRPSGGSGTGGTGGGNSDPATYAYQRYINQGINPVVAAAIVGNLDVESGWDPAVINGTRRGDQGTAAHIAQWRGPRLENLYKFSQSRGHDRPTFDDQLDFIIYEGEQGLDDGARQALIQASQAGTVEEATEHFMTNYERPNADPNINHLSRRQAAAAAIHGGGTTGGTGVTGTDQITTSDPYSISGGGQRRYGVDPRDYEMPGMGPAPAQPGVSTSFDPSQVGRDYVWTEEDKKAFLGPEYGLVPPDVDIVGPGGYYTGEQIAALGPSAQYLFPVSKMDSTEGAGYLHTVPRMPGASPTPTAVPASTSAPMQTAPGSAPPIEIQPIQTPQAPQAAPGMGTEAPSQSFPGVTSAGGQRVRQDPATGAYMMFDGSQWIPLSG